MIFKVIKPKEKVGVLLGIVNIVIPATKVQKTPAKPSYRLVGDLHRMQGVSGSSPLGSTFYKH